MLPNYVYVASSWRCNMQDAVISVLRAAKIDCYDFKNPDAGTGFHWSEVMPSFTPGTQLVNHDDYLQALDHPRSIQGFEADFAAMNKADTFVLVLPCGRSAHLELGWAIGQGKNTCILLDGQIDHLVTPELMYKMVDHIAIGIMDLLEWLKVPN